MQNKTYTLSQLSHHATKESCWMAIYGKIYDVTAYIDDHPGGEHFILQGCGKDATNLFEDKSGMGGHTAEAFSIMKNFYIGDLEGGEK